MWTRQIFGVESYYILLWFLLYSIMGWCVESIYMSICNRRLTNRGFVRGPFCPIYGIGALGVYFLLRGFQGDYLRLYFCGALLATIFEFLVAKLMQKLFGQIWWDYSEKPFNYKGIICLESTIAWGFYTLFMFCFLQGFVENAVNRVDMPKGIFIGKMLMFIFAVDLLSTLYKILKSDRERDLEEDASRVEEIE